MTVDSLRSISPTMEDEHVKNGLSEKTNNFKP